jgi:hypothetical protein
MPCAVTAQVDLYPTSGGFTPDPNNPLLFKTSPMAESETLYFTWGIHSSYGPSNWAGVRFKSHLLDSTEMDLVGITVFPGLLGQATLVGPTANSSGVQATWWHANALDSGTAFPTSQVVTFGAWTIEARNTTVAGNSDIDASIAASSILHVVPGSYVYLAESNYVWATSNFDPTPSEPFPENPPFPGDVNGHWVHLGFTVTYLVPSALGSNFYAVPLANQGFIGIEHIPEPATGLLLLVVGCGALIPGRRARRRRLS